LAALWVAQPQPVEGLKSRLGNHAPDSAHQGRAPFADSAASVDRVARVVQARIEACVGHVLLGSGKIAEGVCFGMNRRDQRAGKAQGEQGGIELLDALGQLLFDVGDLLAHCGQVIEDRAELRFGEVFCLACADGLLGCGDSSGGHWTERTW